jgi:hypothetical protein
VFPEGASGVPASLRAVLAHGLVMPAIAIVEEPKWGAIMSVQHSGLSSGGPWSVIATVLWAGLLGAGLWAQFSVAATIGRPLALAAHLMVYSIYGEETFLYSLHIVPILVATLGCATHTKVRVPVIGVAAILTVMVALHNYSALTGALKFLETGAR